MSVMFCTIQDVKDFLQIDVDEPSTARAIGAVTEEIKGYCHQQIERVTDDVYTFDVRPGRWNLILPDLPVISVSSVIEDGELLVIDDDYKLALYGQLIRVGRRWASGVQIVAVTYTHGYETIPADIVDVATRAASRAYQAGLKAADAEGVPGVQAKSLGDFSVTFGAEGAEGVMGASAARALLLSEKDILNRYRMKGA